MSWLIVAAFGFVAILFAGGIAYFLTGWLGRTILAPPAPPWAAYLASWLLVTTAYGRAGPTTFVIVGTFVAALHSLVWLDRWRRDVQLNEVPSGERAR